MNVYVASSWRNMRQPEVVSALRRHGHTVYDFRDAALAFNWRTTATAEQLSDPRRFRDEVLTTVVARRGFHADYSALSSADATVLVLPCGRSAHLELGYAVGMNQKTIILLDDPLSEPELMYLACSKLCTTIGEVVGALVRP